MAPDIFLLFISAPWIFGGRLIVPAIVLPSTPLLSDLFSGSSVPQAGSYHAVSSHPLASLWNFFSFRLGDHAQPRDGVTPELLKWRRINVGDPLETKSLFIFMQHLGSMCWLARWDPWDPWDPRAQGACNQCLPVQDTQVSEEPQSVFVQARHCCSIPQRPRKYRGKWVVTGHCAQCKICILAFS